MLIGKTNQTTPRFPVLRLKALPAFMLGLMVGFGIASHVCDSAPEPETVARAAPHVVAPPTTSTAASKVDAKLEHLPSIGQRPTPTALNETFGASAPSVDATLFDTVDAYRGETIPAEAPTELVAEMPAPEAAAPALARSVQVESAEETDLRLESEEAVPQNPPATGTSLLPHERL